MVEIVEVYPPKIKSLSQFVLTIETGKPKEVELGNRFLAELNELRDVRTSRLAEDFKARCEPEPAACEPEIVGWSSRDNFSDFLAPEPAQPPRIESREAAKPTAGFSSGKEPLAELIGDNIPF